jgi:hypothetical protein
LLNRFAGDRLERAPATSGFMIVADRNTGRRDSAAVSGKYILLQAVALRRAHRSKLVPPIDLSKMESRSILSVAEIDPPMRAQAADRSWDGRRWT